MEFKKISDFATKGLIGTYLLEGFQNSNSIQTTNPQTFNIDPKTFKLPNDTVLVNQNNVSTNVNVNNKNNDNVDKINNLNTLLNNNASTAINASYSDFKKDFDDARTRFKQNNSEINDKKNNININKTTETITTVFIILIVFGIILFILWILTMFANFKLFDYPGGSDEQLIHLIGLFLFGLLYLTIIWIYYGIFSKKRLLKM